MSDNPFLNGELQQIANDARDEIKKQLELRTEEGRKLIAESGVKLGDLVTATWKIDDAYGGGTKSHIGPVSHLDDRYIEINPSNRSPGHLRLPLSSLHYVRIEREGTTEPSFDDVPSKPPVAANPFMTAPVAIKSDNPFMR